MDLSAFLTSNNDITMQVAQFLTHHDVERLAQSCPKLRNHMHNSTILWKEMIGQSLPDVSLDNLHFDAKLGLTLSSLVSSKLCNRKALKPLGLLDAPFEATQMQRRYFDYKYNPNRTNEHMCLLIGNNGTQDLNQWQELPCRRKRNPKEGPDATSLEYFESVWKRPRRGHNEVRLTNDDIDGGPWKRTELDLLQEAGCTGMTRVGDQVRHVVDAMVEATPRLPSRLCSGTIALDPQLQVSGASDLDLSLPLSIESLQVLIRRGDPSTLGMNGQCWTDVSLRDSYTLALGVDKGAQIGNPAFQEYITSLCGDVSSKEGAPLIRDTIIQPLVHRLGKTPSELSNLSLTVRPSKLLIYSKGGNSMKKRDRSDGPGHLGTLVVLLPVSSTTTTGQPTANVKRGGELAIWTEHNNGDTQDSTKTLQEHVYPSPTDEASWHAFTLGTLHEVSRVKQGYQVALTFQIWLDHVQNHIPMSLLPRQNDDALSLFGKVIARWVASNGLNELVEFVMPLSNNYELENLDFEGLSETRLRGNDVWLYHGLQRAFSDTKWRPTLEYSLVVPPKNSSPVYPHGMVRRRYYGLHGPPLPHEENAKVVWLHRPDTSPTLVESTTEKPVWEQGEVAVATISFRHRQFCPRESRSRALYAYNTGWSHPNESKVTLRDRQEK